MNEVPITSRANDTDSFPKSRPVLAGWRLHPMRERLYSELHNRPFHLLENPAQLSHLAIQHGGKLQEREQALLADLCDRFGVVAPTDSMPCFHQDFGLFSLRWERHMEFSTYTFIRQAARREAPFQKNAIDAVPRDWLASLPGELVAAVHVEVEGASAGNSSESLAPVFDHMLPVGSAASAGRSQIWTSFKLHEDGFGRFLVCDDELTPAQRGRLVQRVLELETYRLMATLGLPLAQDVNAVLTQLDQQLKLLTTRIAQANLSVSDRELLAEVSSMAARVEDLRTQSNYRFAATRAYYDVIRQRMEELREQEISGHLTVGAFLRRRISPAVKTCRAVENRLESISRRVARASELLRTRVELVVQEQNQDLMKTMNRRVRVQLRLQQTVEGLSVAAISYYAIQLIDLILGAGQASGLVYDRELLLGAAVPVVIGTVFFATRVIHKRLFKGV